MCLSLNVRQYRLEHHLSQEYVAEKLHMSQSTYSRLEKNDEVCAKRLSQLAEVMGTVPDILTNYHLTRHENGEYLPAEWVLKELQHQREENKHQQETIKFQDTYIRYVHGVITVYNVNDGKPLNEPPLVIANRQ